MMSPETQQIPTIPCELYELYGHHPHGVHDGFATPAFAKSGLQLDVSICAAELQKTDFSLCKDAASKHPPLASFGQFLL